jgi:hypothetical protein
LSANAAKRTVELLNFGKNKLLIIRKNRSKPGKIFKKEIMVRLIYKQHLQVNEKLIKINKIKTHKQLGDREYFSSLSLFNI